MSLSKLISEPSPDEGHFFEGAEKLLEIWFAEDEEASNSGSLR
jgi:hypothetical protein